MATDGARAFPHALATRTSGRTQISRQALELAMVTSRSREASEVVPYREVGAVGSFGAEDDQPPARSAHPKILSGPRRRPIPPETDGTFRLDEIQPRTIRARVSSINVRSFPIKCVFHGALRLPRCALSRPSVGHRVIRRPATHPRFRNPSRAFRAIDQTPHRRPVLNPSPRSARDPLASTSRRPDCRRPPPGGVEAPPRESNRARATPNTPPARPAARSS